jgi:hypothetical protein
MRRRSQCLLSLLDGGCRLLRWPRRAGLREAALAYLATKFDFGRTYEEQAVNAILRAWTAFDDPALLRRELFDAGYLARTRDCRQYWRLAQLSGAQPSARASDS